MKPLGIKKILWLSIPATLSVMVEPIAGIVDTAFLGQISSEYLAGIALASATFSTLTWIFNFLIYGVTARVANALGASQPDEAGREIQMGYTVALCAGVLATILILVFHDFVLKSLLGASDNLVDLTSPYFFVRAFNFPLVLFISVSIGTLRGAGYLNKAFGLLVLITLSNIALTYVFLFHWNFGFVGAAWGTLISYGLGVLLALGLLWKSRKALGLVQIYRIELKRLFEFGGDSINIFFRTAALTGSFFILTSFATRLGELDVAAHQALFQFWIIPPFVIDGLAIVGTTYGGQSLGRGDQSAFYSLGKKLVSLGSAFGLLFMVFYFFFLEDLTFLFTSDEQVVARMKSIFPLIALLQIPNALVYIYDGLLFGSRNFAFLRKRMIEGFFLLFLPTALFALLELQSLFFLWVALGSLYLYRFVSAAIFFHFGIARSNQSSSQFET